MRLKEKSLNFSLELSQSEWGQYKIMDRFRGIKIWSDPISYNIFQNVLTGYAKRYHLEKVEGYAAKFQQVVGTIGRE